MNIPLDLLNGIGVESRVYNFVIPNGTKESASVDLKGWAPLKIIYPPTFAGTKVEMLLSYEDTPTVFYPYYNATGNKVAPFGAATTIVGLFPSDMIGMKHVKLLSDANETDVTVQIIAQRLV